MGKSVAGKAGRPKTDIDIDEAEKLGSLMCTLAECSAWLGVPLGTLATHQDFQTAYKKGKERGKISLRRLMLKHAQNNPTACIWLTKNMLGMKDTPDPDDDSTDYEMINRYLKRGNSESK